VPGHWDYLRTIRLEGARAMLRQSDARHLISDIALCCGFTHFGRFSGYDRRALGETPIQTRSQERTWPGLRSGET
jgi:transcriptional regulator GlxA family with amidase domain